MIKSMTGYGSAKGTSGKLKITVELRSVNNRFLDCSVRIPRVYTALEDMIKAQVGKSISRGKVDVFVTIDFSEADDVEIVVNESVAEAYVNAVRKLSEKYSLPNDLTALSLAKMQDVLSVQKAETDMDSLGRDISAILAEAIADFDAMRSREGAKLREDVLNHLNEVERLRNLAVERSPKTVSEYREKLLKRMREVLDGAAVDESRIVTEAALFADKTAVDEETVRLESHISQLRSFMEASAPIGRKVDFLVQEFNREANTIGSKGNDVEMARIVVDLKSEIEKIREQIQNIE
ncbi:MAG: YicC family protein [Oscillospiraceae bacterium]|nr:YicC family protein [Oscillospiraceae bacterium]